MTNSHRELRKSEWFRRVDGRLFVDVPGFKQLTLLRMGKMTYERAIEALITAGLLDPAKKESAMAALDSPSVEFTYPDCAKALAEAGLIELSNVEAAANVMQAAGEALAEQDPDAFKKGLENAGIL